MVALVALAALLQGDAWTVWPRQPLVGDTVWIERTVPAPAGWRVRPGRLSAGETFEPLTDPQILRGDDAWVVRYAVVMWAPGATRLSPPPVWRLGPAGEADSLESGTVTVAVRSVIPDSIRAPAPQPAMAPLWTTVRRPWSPLLAAAIATLVLAGGIAWRRRAPRAPPAAEPHPAVERVADERWIAAGEPRAVAARAVHDLRAALWRALPAAHPALSTFEVLAITARELPADTQRELAAVMQALDQVGFAAVHGAEIRSIVQRARVIARGLGA